MTTDTHREKMLDKRYAVLEKVAERLGAEDGKAAAEWHEQYNTGGRASDEHARQWAETVLRMDDDSDPELYDSVPTLDLSGQWADGPTDDDVLREILGEAPAPLCDIPEDWPMYDEDSDDELRDQASADELIEAYRQAYDSAAYDEIIRQARTFLESVS